MARPALLPRPETRTPHRIPRNGRSTVIVIELPWPKPPVKSNGSRGGHRAHAALIRTTRNAASIVGRNYLQHNGPLPHPCEVRMVWTVTNQIQRDTMNLAWTMKPTIDGFVDAHLWPNDHAAIIPISSQAIQTGTRETLTIEIRKLVTA